MDELNKLIEIKYLGLNKNLLINPKIGYMNHHLKFVEAKSLKSSWVVLLKEIHCFNYVILFKLFFEFLRFQG